jgi:hypothetical protein
MSAESISGLLRISEQFLSEASAARIEDGLGKEALDLGGQTAAAFQGRAAEHQKRLNKTQAHVGVQRLLAFQQSTQSGGMGTMTTLTNTY